jgi:membrane-bound ClpP family serine protease
VTKWGALAAGSVLLVLGGLLFWLGLTSASVELPLMALVRMSLESMMGVIFVLSGVVTLIAGTWTAIRGRHQIPDGLERDLLISREWPNKTEW